LVTNNFVVLPCSDELYPELKKLSSEITKVALELGGTCTGEHGVGLGKRDALKAEVGAAFDTMKLIKSALDPKNILNPGKVL